MIRLAFVIFAFSAAARAETFRFQPSVIMFSNCETALNENCTEEFIIPGIVEITMVDGYGEWTQSYDEPSGNHFSYGVTVVGQPGDYEVFAIAQVKNDATGDDYRDGYFNISTPSDTALNRVATSSMSLPLPNGKFSSVWLQIEPPADAP